jgi:GDP-L-fucose synthase
VNFNDKILILGGTGLLGSALLNQLLKAGYKNILKPRRSELDLFLQADVEKYFEQHRPDYVFFTAARVGGINANDTLRGDFILENLQIQQSVFCAALKVRTPFLMFFAGACIYPVEAAQPMKELFLLTGGIESTSEPYAIAKIAGIKTVENIRRQYGLNWTTLIPASLYGTNDCLDPEKSHVIPGLISRLRSTMTRGDDKFSVWGTGTPRREFLHIDDLARACVLLATQETPLPYFINVGSGYEVTIRELALLVASTLGYEGSIDFDHSKPDGVPRKLLDSSFMTSLGWRAEIDIREGLRRTIQERGANS